jgi:hypothetical protein
MTPEAIFNTRGRRVLNQITDIVEWLGETALNKLLWVCEAGDAIDVKNNPFAALILHREAGPRFFFYGSFQTVSDETMPSFSVNPECLSETFQRVNLFEVGSECPVAWVASGDI